MTDYNPDVYGQIEVTPPDAPLAGELHPQEKACSSFMPDGRSEICARCDWPDEAHDTRGN